MGKKTTIEEVKRRIFEKHGNTISIVESTYVGVKYKAIFVNNEGRRWPAKVHHILSGGGHGGTRLTVDEVKRRLLVVHGDSISLVEDSFKGGALSYALFKHKTAGEWSAIVNNVLSGSTHPQVAIDNRKLTLTEVKRRIFEIHGDSVSLKEDTYINTCERAIFIHKDGKEWPALVYNVLNGMSNTGPIPKLLTESQVESRVKKVHGDDIKLVSGTFVNTQSNAKFVDKYGEFEALVNNIFRGQGSNAGRREKSQKTNLDRYGVTSPMQNKTIATKAAKASRQSVTKTHWKTGEELVCQGSYEPKVVDYLNGHKIDFQWQSQTFITSILTPTGNPSMYRPDLYLVNENKWIEIKGYFRKDAKEKWDWFQSQYPNSELWDQKKLKEMGIL